MDAIVGVGVRSGKTGGMLSSCAVDCPAWVPTATGGLDVKFSSRRGGSISWLFCDSCEATDSCLDRLEVDRLLFGTWINPKGGVLPSGLRWSGDMTLPSFIISGERMKPGLVVSLPDTLLG